jgi:ribosomal protein L7/L12
MKKITIHELTDLCRKHGIRVLKISRNYAYVDDDPIIKHAPMFLQKIWAEDKKNENDPSFKWQDEAGIPLRNYILDDMKISAIKIIRMHTGMGLAECRDYVFKNWEDWKKKI